MRRFPSSSPKTGRRSERSQRAYSQSGNRDVKVNRGVVSTVESENSEEEGEDEHDYTSETPPIDFDSEDDSDEDYEDDATKIPCFRVVVKRIKSDDTKDLDVEPQSSESSNSNTETEVSDSTQSGRS